MKSRNEYGQYVPGSNGQEQTPIGTIRVRIRHKRGSEQRSYIKTAQPGKWVLLSRFVWEQTYGAIPKGMLVHHKDGNTLNDAVENLAMVTKQAHLDLHRDEYKERTVANLVKLRRERRWSTRSSTKQNGRPRAYLDKTLLIAIGTYFVTDREMSEIATEFNIPIGTFRRKVHAVKAALRVHE